jgi:hypothetical protein
MKFNTQIKTVIHRTESGLLIPAGVQQDSTGHATSGLLDLKDKALAIEALYKECALSISPQSGLARVLYDAKHIADQWMLNQDKNVSGEQQLRTTHFGQFADSIINLRNVQDRTKYLARLLSGPLDNYSIGQSDAKNTLWELELWSSLIRREFTASLIDPPDIVLSIDKYDISIACKKLYSEKHVQNVLSEAVKQVEKHSSHGIVAINIDEFGGSGKVFMGKTVEHATSQLHQMNIEFLGKHDRHFRKYLKSERIAGALISIGCVSDLLQSTPRLNFVRMHTIWSLTDRSPDQARCLDNIMKAFRN